MPISDWAHDELHYSVIPHIELLVITSCMVSGYGHVKAGGWRRSLENSFADGQLSNL